MRLAIAAALLAAACNGPASRGAAWPKSAGTVAPDDYKDDGGESLEPRASHVAALEVAPDESPPAGAAADKAPEGKGTTLAPENPPVPTVETIEIQIEDIQIGPGDIIINGP